MSLTKSGPVNSGSRLIAWARKATWFIARVLACSAVFAGRAGTMTAMFCNFGCNYYSLNTANSASALKLPRIRHLHPLEFEKRLSHAAILQNTPKTFARALDNLKFSLKRHTKKLNNFGRLKMFDFFVGARKNCQLFRGWCFCALWKFFCKRMHTMHASVDTLWG